MGNTIIATILGLSLLAGIAYIFILVVKALRKYINSDKTSNGSSKPTE